MNERIVWIAFVLLVGFASCKKDLDENRPTVRFELPAEYSTFNVSDTIAIVVEASDDREIERVVIDLVDADFVRVLPAISRSGNGASSLTVGVSMVINDNYLPSGTYYLRAIAEDGTNIKTEFIEISLNELPLELERIFAFRAMGPNTVAIDTLSGNTWHSAASVDLSWNQAVVNSFHSEVLLSDGDAGDLRFLDGLSLEPNGSVSLPVEPLPGAYWKDLWYDSEGRRYFLSGNDGWVRSYRQSGIQEISFMTEGQFRPGEVFATSNRILVELEPIVGTQRALGVYFRNSGVFLQSVLTGIDIVAMVSLNQDELLLFGDDGNGNGRILRYFLSANGFDEPINWNQDGIRQAILTPQNHIFITHSTGISRISYSSPGSFQVYGITPFGDFSQLEYEAVSGTLLVHDSGNQQLVQFNSALSQVQTIALPPQTAGFGLLYNK